MSTPEIRGEFEQSRDAADWAKAFVEIVARNPALALDEGFMIGWFANAMSVMHTAVDETWVRLIKDEHDLLSDLGIYALRHLRDNKMPAGRHTATPEDIPALLDAASRDRGLVSLLGRAMIGTAHGRGATGMTTRRSYLTAERLVSATPPTGLMFEIRHDLDDPDYAANFRAWAHEHLTPKKWVIYEGQTVSAIHLWLPEDAVAVKMFWSDRFHFD